MAINPAIPVIFLVLIIIAIIAAYFLLNKTPVTVNTNNATNATNANVNNTNNTNNTNNVPATTTTNGYITNGTVVPITSLSITISDATYINYTSAIPFTVTGTSTTNKVSSNINMNILANTSYTLAADNISINLVVTPVVDLYSKGSSLSSNSTLQVNEYITNKTLKLMYQPDGNLVLSSNGLKTWSSNTNGSSANKVVFDGNLKIINNQNNIVWQTSTPVNSTAILVFHGTGVDIQDASGNTVWSTNGGLATLLVDATRKFILQLKNTNVCLESNMKSEVSGTTGTNDFKNSGTGNLVNLFNCDNKNKNQILNYNQSDQTMKFDNGLYLDTNNRNTLVTNTNKPGNSGTWSFDFSLGKLFNPNNANLCVDAAGNGITASGNFGNYVYNSGNCDASKNQNQQWNLLYN